MMATVTASASQSRAPALLGLANARYSRNFPCWSVRETLGSWGVPGAGNTRVRSESGPGVTCTDGARCDRAADTWRADGQPSSGPGVTSTDTARKVKRANCGCTEYLLYYRSVPSESPAVRQGNEKIAYSGRAISSTK